MNMWKKISTAISILCIAVYVFATARAVYRIIVTAAEQRTVAEREFAGLQDVVRGATVLGFRGTDLENEIRAAVFRSHTLEAVIASIPDGNSVAVEKPGERVIIPDINNSDYSFNTKWKFYRQPYVARITTDARINLELSALTNYLDKGQLGDILREALFFILLSVTAAFIVLLLDVIAFGNWKLAPETPSKAHGAPIPSKKPQSPSISPQEPFDIPVIPQKAQFPSAVMEAPPDLPVIPQKAQFPSAVTEAPPDLPVIPQEPQDPLAGTDEPAGLYVGLIQKLQAELAAADNEKSDLVLLCAEWTETGAAGEPLTKQIAEEAAAFFKIPQMSAFKRGSSGIFILLPNIAFKRGLKAAREFYGHVFGKAAFETTIANLSIGLSSRADRMLDPERLILEAEKAVEKAKESPDQPIVAFKANPLKYKNYINKHKTA
jgi:hypothetical protein